MAERAYRRNQWIEASFWDRGSLRNSMARVGIEFTETKSLMSSVFQLKVTPEHWALIRKDFERQGVL